MNDKSEWVEVAAFWEKTDQRGSAYLSGSLSTTGGKKIPITNRAVNPEYRKSDKSPSHRLFMSRTEAEALGLTINERVQTPAAPKEPFKKIVQPTIGKIGFPNFQEDDLPF